MDSFQLRFNQPQILLFPFYAEKPGQASIISTEADVQASSLTVRWTAPADDGGSPITAYRLIMLKGDTEINSVNITGLPKTSHTFSGLEKDTNYTVKAFARNYVFEGDAALKTLKTKFEGEEWLFHGTSFCYSATEYFNSSFCFQSVIMNYEKIVTLYYK